MMRSVYAVIHFQCDKYEANNEQGTCLVGTRASMLGTDNRELSLFENLTPDVLLEMMQEQFPGWKFTEAGGALCPKHQ